MTDTAAMTRPDVGCPAKRGVFPPPLATRRGESGGMPGQAGIFAKPARHCDFPVAIAKLFSHIGAACGVSRASGCSSGVEHNLAKVGVERSNRFTRSK